MKEQNYKVEIRKINLFVNSSPEGLKGVIYLYNKTENNTRCSSNFCGNALKLDLEEKANQMEALGARWDL